MKKIILSIGRRMVNKLAFIWFLVKFKINNRHNIVYPKNQFRLNSVKIGKGTYGGLNIHTYSKLADEKLILGNYISIANEVHFILGGNHQINTLTTYPVFSLLLNNKNEKDSLSKGPIIVEDEVWIGYGSIILSGVTLKKGAIISAGSVVTKDVEPYTIVGGNPAKEIRKRFTSELITELLKFDLSKLSTTEIKKISHLLYQPLTMEILKEINSIINKK